MKEATTLVAEGKLKFVASFATQSLFEYPVAGSKGTLTLHVPDFKTNEYVCS